MMSSSLGTVKPKWVDDSLVNECSKCRKTFGFWTRKHHCRRCGKIFCKDCSNHNIVIPKLVKFYGRDPQRVCDTCFHQVRHESSSKGLAHPTYSPAVKKHTPQRPGGAAQNGQGGRGVPTSSNPGAPGASRGRGRGQRPVEQPGRTAPAQPKPKAGPPPALRSGRDLFIMQTLQGSTATAPPSTEKGAAETTGPPPSQSTTPEPSAPPQEPAPSTATAAQPREKMQPNPHKRHASGSTAMFSASLERYKKKDEVFNSIFDDIPEPAPKALGRRTNPPPRSHSETSLAPKATATTPPPAASPLGPRAAAATPTSPTHGIGGDVGNDIFGARPPQNTATHRGDAASAAHAASSGAQAPQSTSGATPPQQATAPSTGHAPAADGGVPPTFAAMRRPSLSLFDRPDTVPVQQPVAAEQPLVSSAPPQTVSLPVAQPEPEPVPTRSSAPAAQDWGAVDPFANDAWDSVQRDPDKVVVHRPPEPEPEPEPVRHMPQQHVVEQTQPVVAEQPHAATVPQQVVAYACRQQMALPPELQVPPRDGGLEETPHMRSVQEKLFLRWTNYWLSVRDVSIPGISAGLCDGTMLVALVEILTNVPIGPYHTNPTNRYECEANIDNAIFHANSNNLRLPPSSVTAIADGNVSVCLDVVWALMYRIEVQTSVFQGESGIGGVLGWLQMVTDGYGVNIFNFTTSFQDGLAYCAIVHRYNAALVDWGSLDPTYGEANLRLAFDQLHEYWRVPKLLDPEDIVTQPDDVSTIAYLSMCFKILNGM